MVVPSDFDEFERSEKVKVTSCMRPWFRAFHFAWIGFFTAFLGWFSFAPLMTYVKEDLNLDLPPSGHYGMGNVFLPTDESQREHCQQWPVALSRITRASPS